MFHKFGINFQKVVDMVIGCTYRNNEVSQLKFISLIPGKINSPILVNLSRREKKSNRKKRSKCH